MQKRPGRGWAWTVLLTAGGNQLLWNLWHAFATGMPEPLALALGAMPVLLAIGTSAIATRVRGGRIHRGLTYGVMLSAIGLSIWAQYELLMLWTRSVVVAVLFPAVGDLAVLIALHTLISETRADRSAVRETGRRRFGWLVRRTGAPVPDGVPVQAPVQAPVPDAGHVPVRVGEETAEPAGADRPLDAPVPDRVPEPVPAAAPVRTAGPERPVPAVRTGTVPAEQTGTDRTAQPGTGRAGTPVHADDVPALTSPKDGDEAALEQLDAAFAGTDPAEVSIGMVRKQLGGAGFARGKRLHGLWVANRQAAPTRTGAPDRGADRSGAEPGTGVDGPQQDDGPGSHDEADRTADRVTVPA